MGHILTELAAIKEAVVPKPESVARPAQKPLAGDLDIPRTV